MQREKIRAAVLLLLEGAVFLGLIITAGMLLGTYIQYGERMQQGTSEEPVSEHTRDSSLEETEQTVSEADFNPDIRVRITTESFEEQIHKKMTVSGAEGLRITVYNDMDSVSDEFCTSPQEPWTAAEDQLPEGTVVKIEGTDSAGIRLDSIRRADGCPEYSGILLLYREADGIAVINQLPLETYLCGVVSSEMPSYYPEEAQKAQAVCARTYAWNCIKAENRRDRLADLDDSVNFQVYNNYRSSEQSKSAVAETAGERLPLEEVLYYSTSCLSENETDLCTDELFRSFLEQPTEEHAEYGSPWLRWTAVVSEEQILSRSSLFSETEVQSLDAMSVASRSENGQVQTLELICDGETYLAEGEYLIRRILVPDELILKNGEMSDALSMLPSGFFYIESQEEQTKNGDADGADTDAVFFLYGGGYGHGIGMSQCGAAAMAENGAEYGEILRYYFGTDII